MKFVVREWNDEIVFESNDINEFKKYQEKATYSDNIGWQGLVLERVENNAMYFYFYSE